MRLPTHNRVAVYYSNSDIRIETRAVPRIGPGELLLEVTASGICGSDIMEWYRRPRAPIVLGHEVSGRVVALGEGPSPFQVGDRVVVSHHVPCLECRYCRSNRETACDLLHRTALDPGGFAGLVRVPITNVERGGVLRVPDQVSDDAASMVEPLACVLRGQDRAGVRADDTVLVLGAGVSGCLHLLAARQRGAASVFVADPLPERLRTAQQLGAAHVFDARQPVGPAVRATLGGRGVDRVIVCTGATQAVAEALTVVDRGGSVLYFAPLQSDDPLSIPFNALFWQHQAALVSSYGAAPADLARALALIAECRVDLKPLVTHRLPLQETQRGFALMLEARDSLKVIIDPRLDNE